MKNTIRIIYVFLIVALLSVLGPNSGFADREKQTTGTRDGSIATPRNTNAITISGITTGSLSGSVNLGGREIVISKHTRIYKTDRGLLRHGTLVVDAPIYAICVEQRGQLLAKLVIVSDRKQTGQQGEAGILSPDAPQ